MTTQTRIALTVALGIVLCVWFWGLLVEPNPGDFGVLESEKLAVLLVAIISLIPLLVGRFWIIAALAGPVVLLALFQAVGYDASGWDGVEAQPFNGRIIFNLGMAAIWLQAMTAVRIVWDGLRGPWRGRSKRYRRA